MRGLKIVGLTAFLALAGMVHAGGEESPRRRAKPPQWSQEVRDVFFDDARKELVGNRPVLRAAKTQAEVVESEGSLQNVDSSWSDLIDAETLQSEVKQTINNVAGAIATSGKFNGEGHQQCQRDFSLLAVLFGVIEEFDEQVRWQRNAGVVRRHLKQAAAMCEEASEESYSAAKQEYGLLTDLLRGQPTIDDSLQEKGQVERSQLMLRMEQSVEEVLGSALSSKKNFRRRSTEVIHESQLLAVLAKLIVEEGYESADDEEFSGFARQLGEASTALVQAAKEENYEAARSAVGRLTQSCSTCHEDFRG